MFSFASWLDLPMIWGGLIGLAILMYVLLDGFDLGIGILFPFAPSQQCRDKMMNSIAPFWDGNETWLVLGGGGLFAAFPLAYAIVMPAFYLPIIIMLLGLIFRGVAFEFRFKASQKQKKVWDYIFHFGSLTASFMQGMILGGFVRGVKVEERHFAGGPFDWLSAFSVMTGIAVVFGYILLGSTWLIMKTEGKTNGWARKTGSYSLVFIALFMLIVSISMPFVDPLVKNFWFNNNNFIKLLPIPLLTSLVFILLWFDLANKKREIRPFLLSQSIFFLGYLGLGLSMWPWIVPFAIKVEEAAASATSLSLLLIGAAIMLPIILSYTAYCYYIFRGKIDRQNISY